MNNEKLYIGNKGWTGTTVHAIRCYENGTPINYDAELCHNYKTTLRPVVRIKKVEATTENVTCKNCAKRLSK